MLNKEIGHNVLKKYMNILDIINVRLITLDLIFGSSNLKLLMCFDLFIKQDRHNTYESVKES